MTQPPSPPPHGQPPRQEALPGCWWHPNRQTGLRCVRCERPACPECLREASVGYQCVDCVNAARKQQRTQAAAYRRAGYGARTVAGARVADRAVVTPVLIGINAAIFVLTALLASDPLQNHLSRFFADGTMQTLAVAYEGEWWRLFTSGFLHYGLVHLGMNMLVLWFLGRDVELLLGKVRFLTLYFVAMLAGSVAVYAFGDFNTATAGASGAIYGLLGALLVAVLRLKLNPTMAIGIIVLNLVLSVSIPGISLLGHVGGLIAGALVMVAMVYAPERNRTAYQAGAVAVLVAGLLGVYFYRSAELCSLVPGVC